jgi:hypothetical protein
MVAADGPAMAAQWQWQQQHGVTMMRCVQRKDNRQPYLSRSWLAVR